MDVISVEELSAWSSEGKPFTLLDVREPVEVQTAAIPGAFHIPMRDIPARHSELPKSQPVVVMCHHGGRSERVAAFLKLQGFSNAINLEGGIDAWSLRIDPQVPRY